MCLVGGQFKGINGIESSKSRRACSLLLMIGRWSLGPGLHKPFPVF